MSTPTTHSPATQGADDADNSIQWCLLSHTNIGKTTLARTLLVDDVGEIQDAAHVTSQSQRYLLQSTAEGDRLWLWDTPGFGDSVRLYGRLQQQGNPLGWFLSNVWDRWRDKPFYMSQRALLAARDHADVMLYLVNAAEDPADAGYWDSEMRILQWMNKPVVVLLNQIGSDTTPAQTAADLARWQKATASFDGTVRAVQVLDAFTRSWWHERQVMESIAPLLPQAKQAAYQRLLQEREQRQLQRERASVQAMAQQLIEAATLSETAPEQEGNLWQRAISLVTSKRKEGEPTPQEAATMQRVLQQLQQQDVACTQTLLQLHQLDGQAASQIQEQLRAQIHISTPFDTRAASLWGAVTAGAATGLGADAMTGGLSLGAGALLGALVGAVTFAGAAWGANKVFDQESQRFQLSTDYLNALVAQVLLKYLAISHFGRGRGRYTSPTTPQQWHAAVQHTLAQRSAQWLALWQALRATPASTPATDSPGDISLGAHRQTLHILLEQSLQQVLQQLYPSLYRPTVTTA